MAKWKIYFKETVVKSVEVEAPDRMTATKKFDQLHSVEDAELVKKPSKLEFLSVEEVDG